MRAALAAACAAAFGARVTDLAPGEASIAATALMVLLAIAAVVLARPWIGLASVVVGIGAYATALIATDAPVDALAPIVALIGLALLEATEVSRVTPHLERGVVIGMIGSAAVLAAVAVGLGAVALVLASSARPGGAAAFAGAAVLSLAGLYVLVTAAVRGAGEE